MPAGTFRCVSRPRRDCRPSVLRGFLAQPMRKLRDPVPARVRMRKDQVMRRDRHALAIVEDRDQVAAREQYSPDSCTRSSG